MDEIVEAFGKELQNLFVVRIRLKTQQSAADVKQNYFYLLVLLTFQLGQKLLKHLSLEPFYHTIKAFLHLGVFDFHVLENSLETLRNVQNRDQNANLGALIVHFIEKRQNIAYYRILNLLLQKF
jgi:hypothetical protein